MSLHIDEDNCLEILAVKGTVDKIKAIADKLISVRGGKTRKANYDHHGKGAVVAFRY